jgi:hypothetical protein
VYLRFTINRKSYKLRHSKRTIAILKSIPFAAPLNKKRRAQFSVTHQRGKRGKWSEFQWKLHQEKLENTRYDDEQAELVVIQKFDYLVTIFQEKFPWHTVTFWEPAENGLVLSDSRGRGAFQK